MRRGNELGILKIEDQFVGFNLSADYCAEHEWGIKKLNHVTKRNLRNYKCERVVQETELAFFSKPAFIFVETKKHDLALFVMKASNYEEVPFEKLKEAKTRVQIEKEASFCELHLRKPWKTAQGKEYPGTEIAAAWDESSFGILVSGKENVEYLRELYAAFCNGDYAMWLGGGGVFQNAGFCIAIYSKLPECVTEAWKQNFDDNQRLKKEVAACGIEAKLEKAGRRYFALSPKWQEQTMTTKDGELRTKYPFVFWLNPMDQQNNESGWYTVEDLDDWCQNKGRIPKKKASTESARL